jgi:hypothetical protein
MNALGWSAPFLITLAGQVQDTTVVKSNGPGAWSRTRLIEELRIGSVEGDDRFIFGDISNVEMTRDGSIWVVDSQGPRVRIFDKNGRYVRDVYRPGSGPGELRSVMGIGLTPEGRVATWDVDNHRVSVYQPTGRFVTSFTANSARWGEDNFRVDTSGRFWVYTGVRNRSCVRQFTGPDGKVQEIGSGAPGCIRPAYLRYSRAGILRDTFFVPIPQETERVRSFAVNLPEGIVNPFIQRWDYALSAQGFAVTAISTKYALNVVRENGRSFRVTRIERDYQPIRLKPEERNEWQARADFYTRRSPTAASAGVRIPQVKPALRAISVDSDGRIWVDRYVDAVKRRDITLRPASAELPPQLTWLEPRTFDVFEPGGRFLGTVVAPLRTRFIRMRGNTIWAVARGDLDEAYLVRYRLETN